MKEKLQFNNFEEMLEVSLKLPDPMEAYMKNNPKEDLLKGMTEGKHPKTICVDFDGVVHQYTSGWQGADIISDPPVEGAIAGLYRLTADKEIDVAIHSARSAQDGGIEAMKRWLQRYDRKYREVHNIDDNIPPLTSVIRFPTDKPPAMCYIDDRAVAFNGNWESITTALKDFRPWNR